jgi:hypothetical protein
MTFRVFTNDRGKRKGVPMYSAYTGFTAPDLETAQRTADAQFKMLGPPHYAPVKVIEWPAKSQASKDWLANHVGALTVWLS